MVISRYHHAAGSDTTAVAVLMAAVLHFVTDAENPA
jgi:hypothetical protein